MVTYKTRVYVEHTTFCLRSFKGRGVVVLHIYRGADACVSSVNPSNLMLMQRGPVAQGPRTAVAGFTHARGPSRRNLKLHWSGEIVLSHMATSYQR